jgi:PAS domain S-box-containing protein
MRQGVQIRTNRPRKDRYLSNLLRYAIVFIASAIITALPTFVKASEDAMASKASVRAGAESSYPPFSVVSEKGNAEGFSVELMRAALAAMGREVTFRTGPWDTVRGWLERGEVDALPLVGRTPEREALFDFTVPYMSLHGAIVVRGDEQGIKDLADLRGRQVAVMKGDNAEEFLRRQQVDFSIQTTPNFEIALHELSKGRYDAVVIQRLVGLRLIQQTGLTNLHVLDHPIEEFKQDFCFAVHEGDRETLALLNEGLAIVVANGTYRQLHAKWFAEMQLPTNRPIVVGGDLNFPPFEFLDKNNRPAGYNVDLTRAIARAMNLNVEIRLGRWPERLEALKTGKIDALQGVFYSPERDQDFDFSQAHTVSHYVAVVRQAEGPAPESIEELRGKRIIVQRGDRMHDFVLKHGLEQHLLLVEEQEAVLHELRTGRNSDCALVARIAALSLIEKHGWKDLVLGKKPLLSSEYCYAAANGQSALLAQLSEGLNVLKQNGEYRRIYDKWLGVHQEHPVTFVTALRYSIMVIAPLLLILLVAFAWSWTLRRQVIKKTAALRTSEEYQRAMITCSPVALYTLDMDGKVINWNQSAERIFGWQAEEIIGKPLPTGPNDGEGEFDFLQGAVLAKKDFLGRELMRRKKDGTVFPVSLSVAPIRNDRGEVIGILGAAEDLTERHRAEEQRREGFDLLNTLARLVPGVIYQYRLYPDGRSAFPYSSPGMHDIYEVSPEEVQEDASVVFERLHPEDRDRVTEAILESARTLKTFSCELRVMLPEKGLGWRWSQAHPERTEDGGTLWHGIILDITEHKQAEQALREQEQRLRAIFESTRDAIYLKDTSLRYTQCNRATARMFDKEQEDIIGHTDAELFLVEHANEIESIDRRVLAGQLERGTYRRTIKGAERVFDTSKAPVFDAAGNVVGLCGVSRDITEEVNLREQMRQAQKVEAIGRLAGGVAHDLNNLLSPIIGYGEMLLDDLNARDARRDAVKQIVHAGMRASDLVRQLLAFSRKQVLDFKAVDINGTIQGFEKLLRRTIREDIGIKTILSPNIRPVMADIGQIEQILMNLAVNAADAMPKGGHITIETDLVELDEAYTAARADVQPGLYLLLAFSDTGCGMDSETRERIFEPFFSTKGVHGTGLGLATVYGIVKQHGGNIRVFSEPDQGTTFKIYLPATLNELVEGAPVQKEGTDFTGSETILLVEDNEQLREMAHVVLERKGYTVLGAENGEAALDLLATPARPLHLLLTDVVLPGMNGHELSQRVQERYPELKTLYMSGYNDDVIAHRGVLEQGVQFIQKPFSVQNLAAKVREVLEGG